jgi:cysteinyl-tRNA synthetase
MARLETGETVAMASLATMAGAGAPVAGGADPLAAGTDTQAAAVRNTASAGGSPLLAEVARLQSAFDDALAAADPRGAVKAALALDDLVVEWSRDTLQSDELDRARAALRSMVVRLGEAAEEGLRDPRHVVGPFVDALLAARARARDERRWSEADTLRDGLVDAGVEVHDSPDGTSWELL